MNSELKSYFPKLVVECFFIKWLIDDGSLVRKGDPIYIFTNSSFLSNEFNEIGINSSKTVSIHRSEGEGYIDFYFNSINKKINTGDLMYYIRNNDEIRINRKFKNIPLIENDEFELIKTIKWESVSSIKRSSGICLLSDDLKVKLNFSLNNKNGKEFIVFEIFPSTIKPRKNDSIFFLFDDSEILNFNIENVKTVFDIDNQKVSQVEFLITQDILNKFLKKNLKGWKIRIVSKNLDIKGGEIGDSEFYRTKSNLIYAIKKFTSDYIELVNSEFKDNKPSEDRPLIDRNDNSDFDFCYVYLMHDTSNDFYKIGISGKPSIREKTLQSEKPTIELVCSKKFPIRKIALSFERSLHETYSKKRIRGEWFNLNEVDVKHIVSSLK